MMLVGSGQDHHSLTRANQSGKTEKTNNAVDPGGRARTREYDAHARARAGQPGHLGPRTLAQLGHVFAAERRLRMSVSIIGQHAIANEIFYLGQSAAGSHVVGIDQRTGTERTGNMHIFANEALADPIMYFGALQRGLESIEHSHVFL